MPFYEYQCRHCGHQTEVLQKVSDAPLRKCPDCGRNGLTKLISAPIFRLKGGGWYETDFKTEQDKKRNLAGAEGKDDKAEDKGEAKSDAKADAKVDAKADAKTETKSEANAAAKNAIKTPAKAQAKTAAKAKSAARSAKARKGK